MTAFGRQPLMNKSLLFSTRGLLMVLGPKRLDLNLLHFFLKNVNMRCNGILYHIIECNAYKI